MKITIDIKEMVLAYEAACSIQHELATSHLERKTIGQDKKFEMLGAAMRVTEFFKSIELNFK